MVWAPPYFYGKYGNRWVPSLGQRVVCDIWVYQPLSMDLGVLYELALSNIGDANVSM